MIICKYKDGSSIRVYDSDSKRLKAIKAFLQMGGYAVQRLASYPNYYSLKIMTRDGIVFAEYKKQILNLFWKRYNNSLNNIEKNYKRS
ncbi:MAG: hypothetical protein ACFE9S_07500 [Candidatus Hermodarchaeota archaeon]